MSSPASKDASGAEQPQSGHGLVGMRERAATAGGTFQAGPASGGGFTVTATLPFGPPDQAEDPQPRATDNGAAASSAASRGSRP